MRKLKTPEEIILAASTQRGYDTPEDAYKALIITAQRDALECAAESAKITSKLDDSEYHRGYITVVDKSSILNLMPKEK